jgi:hypothetical protein
MVTFHSYGITSVSHMSNANDYFRHQQHPPHNREKTHLGTPHGINTSGSM